MARIWLALRRELELMRLLEPLNRGLGVWRRLLALLDKILLQLGSNELLGTRGVFGTRGVLGTSPLLGKRDVEGMRGVPDRIVLFWRRLGRGSWLLELENRAVLDGSKLAFDGSKLVLGGRRLLFEENRPALELEGRKLAELGIMVELVGLRLALLGRLALVLVRGVGSVGPGLSGEVVCWFVLLSGE